MTPEEQEEWKKNNPGKSLQALTSYCPTMADFNLLVQQMNGSQAVIEECLDGMRENRLTVRHSMALRKIFENQKTLLHKLNS